MHEFFQVNAGNLEVRADIGDLSCIGFQREWLAGTLPTFFRHDRTFVDPSQAMTNGSATGVPFSRCCAPISP